MNEKSVPKKVEIVEKLGVKREPGLLYYLKGTEVWCSPMTKAGVDATNQAKKVAQGTFKKEAGFLYYLDGNGNVARSSMARKGKPVVEKAPKTVKEAKPKKAAKEPEPTPTPKTAEPAKKAPPKKIPANKPAV